MTHSVGRVFIGLPAYNEEVAIERLFEKIKRVIEAERRDFVVVVYDDGSTDRTTAIASSWQRELAVVLHGRKENLGLGAGVKDLVGYAAAAGAPDDVLVIMDCDDTHDPAQIASMIRSLEAGNDVVIASRFRAGASVVGVPAFRRLTAFGAMALIKALHPIAGVTDYTCGYRAYRVGLLQQATSTFGERLITNLGFVCMVELLLKLNQCDARMVEIPLRLRYDRKPTASKMEAGKHIRQLLHAVIAWRWQGFGRDRARREQG